MSFDLSLFHQFVLLLFLYEDILRCKINFVLQIIKMVIHCFTLWALACGREQTFLCFISLTCSRNLGWNLSMAAQALKSLATWCQQNLISWKSSRDELLRSFLFQCVDTIWLLLATLAFLLNECIILKKKMMNYDTD